MSTSSIPSLTTAINYAIPALTILLGAGGLSGGVYTLGNPSEGAKIFGIPLPAASTSPAISQAYIRALGLRNSATGVSLLTLTGIYGLARLERLPVAATAVKRCLGICTFIGMFVGFGDSWIIGRFVEEVGAAEADEEVREKAAGHMWLAPVIGLVGLGWLFA